MAAPNKVPGSFRDPSGRGDDAEPEEAPMPVAPVHAPLVTVDPEHRRRRRIARPGIVIATVVAFVLALVAPSVAVASQP